MIALLARLLAVPLVLTATLAFAHPAQGQGVTDCSEFTTYDEARAYYADYPEAQPIIDPNYDGRACEIWFGAETGATTRRVGVPRLLSTGSGGLDGVDYDCVDFASQAEAQAYFEADGGSIDNIIDGLDANLNGIACESS